MTDILDDIHDLATKADPKYLYGMKPLVPGKDTIPYSGPYWGTDELEAGVKSFLTGSWLTNGLESMQFERAFARHFGVYHAHFTNSGSSANLLLITALKKHLGWADGSEIIVSPVGFPTTVAPIAQNGMVPVFADIEMDTLNFDLTEVAGKITKKTVAIFVSPVLGNPPNMDLLVDLCKRHNIKLIGDNCDSLGTKWNGEDLTKLYYGWTTSFYAAHHMCTGEGGMVCSNDKGLIETVRSYAWWGRDCQCIGPANLSACGTCGERFKDWLGTGDVIDHKYVFNVMGYNLKALDLQGAIGRIQLKKFPEIERLRRDHATALRAVVSEVKDQNFDAWNAEVYKQADPSWFGVPVICHNPLARTRLVEALENAKIQTRSYFAGNLLMHPGYKHLGNAADYPNAQLALKHVFFVGCPPFYTTQIIDHIRETMLNVYKH